MYTIKTTSEGVIDTGLIFKLRYPLFRTAQDSLDRFCELKAIASSLPQNKDTAPVLMSLFQECDYILNVLEGYDS